MRWHFGSYIKKCLLYFQDKNLTTIKSKDMTIPLSSSEEDRRYFFLNFSTRRANFLKTPAFKKFYIDPRIDNLKFRSYQVRVFA